MLLGELLVAQGLVTDSDVDQALEHQRENGGRLGDCLVALDLIADDTLDDALRRTPKVSATIADIGLAPEVLRDLLLKTLAVAVVAAEADLAEALKLPRSVVAEGIVDAFACDLVETCGVAVDAPATEPKTQLRLTAKGRDWAAAAAARNPYVGPAPVSLARYVQQVRAQAIAGETIDAAAIDAGLAGYISRPRLRRLLGPAVNAGRSLLIYGDGGNGKSLLARHIADLYTQVVYVPHCVAVGDAIVRVFDPALHRPLVASDDAADATPGNADPQWVACYRPIVHVGAELTADMLELGCDAAPGCYDAPLQVKAANGVLIVDDIGRQRDDTIGLMQRLLAGKIAGHDRCSLADGRHAELPNDGLLVLVSGSEAQQVIDEDLMRRIPFKIEVTPPSRPAFAELLRAEAAAYRIELAAADADFIMDQIEEGYGEPLAFYQPSFVIRRLVAVCDFIDEPPAFRRDLAEDAMSNLFAARPRAPGPGRATARALGIAKRG